MMEYIWHGNTPLGRVLLSSDGENLTGLWFEDQKYFGATLEPGAVEKLLPIFEQTQQWLDLYFKGKCPDFMPPMAPKGSDFRKLVWELLCEIPYGQVTTYGEIAKMVARRQNLETMSAQAVGGAVAHNPISVLIPCHRVVGTNGSLTGYAGGLEKKLKLMALEKIDSERFFVPQKGTAL